MQQEFLNKCDLCRSKDTRIICEKNNISLCLNCGYIFDNPRPRWIDIKAFYSRMDKYSSWLSEESGRERLWKKRLKIIRKYCDSGNLLDIGTGIGQFLHLAEEYFNVAGTEVSKTAIKIAKEKYDIQVLNSEIETIELAVKFDLLTLFHVLEHLPSPSAAIARCRELLNDNGFLIIAVPNDVTGLRAKAKKALSRLKIGRFTRFGAIGLAKISLDGTHDEIHLSHFKASVLKSFLERSGFEVIYIGLDPYFTTSGVRRIFSNALFLKALTVFKVTGVNLYPTILVIARKKPS